MDIIEFCESMENSEVVNSELMTDLKLQIIMDTDSEKIEECIH